MLSDFFSGFPSPAEWEALTLSFKISGVGVLAALPLALVTGYGLARWRFPGKALVEAVVHLPLILPPVVMGYLLLISFGTKAPIGGWLLETFNFRFVFSWTGAALAVAVLSFPFQVRAIRLAVEGIDPALEEAAAILGASAFDRFLTLIVPLAIPGILAGAVTAFTAGLGEFGAIITFVSNIPGETRTLPLAIYSVLQSPGGELAAARLALLSITLALLGLVLAEALGRRAQRRLGL